mmetsp:Transcript_3707/g.5057  ORF Transcript_3707/g.5057 Transcript_3707/m.5057 type:complete len:204 (+) Transcript_3707:118-729(+)
MEASEDEGGRGEVKAESPTSPSALNGSVEMELEATASIADGPGFWKHGLLAPYVPSGKEDIKEALQWVKTHCKGINEKTKLFDLGSGDGRVVIEAAQKGFYSVGIELDGKLVEYAKQQAKVKGVADRVTFLKQDFLGVLESRNEEMGIVVVYLLSAALRKIDTKLDALWKNGQIIISFGWPLAYSYWAERVKLKGKNFFIYAK